MFISVRWHGLWPVSALAQTSLLRLKSQEVGPSIMAQQTSPSLVALASIRAPVVVLLLHF